MVAFGLMEPSDVLLSCWITESARSAVLSGRGHGDAANRAAARARLLASALTAHETRIRPDVASGHAEWLAGVVGSEEETGAIGWFFLQRLGKFVDGHAVAYMDSGPSGDLIELGAPDEEAVNQAISESGIPAAPPPEWPEAPAAPTPGEPIARFGLLGDPHIGLDISNQIIPIAIDDLNSEDISFTATVGDLTEEGALDSYKQAKDIFDAFEKPNPMTLGNHDMMGGGEGPEAGLQHWNDVFGLPASSVHEADGIRVVMINSAAPSVSPFRPFDFITGDFVDGPKESVSGGVIGEEAAAFIDTLEPGPPTFIVLHHPPFPYLGIPPVLFGLNEPSSNLLAKAVEKSGAWGVICGHTHRSAIYGFAGVPFIEIPSTKEWPFGYGIVEVSEKGWSLNLKPISDEGLIAEASKHANVIVRRYARGPEQARAFSTVV
jgi:predicted phosphodiesterase